MGWMLSPISGCDVTGAPRLPPWIAPRLPHVTALQMPNINEDGAHGWTRVSDVCRIRGDPSRRGRAPGVQLFADQRAGRRALCSVGEGSRE